MTSSTSAITLHNSLTRKKVAFTPIDPEHVKLYVCGPTVYDRAHLGNARSAVVFDLLYRLLQAAFPRVTYARNITDVDDKINAAARLKQVEIGEITALTTRWYHEDMAQLNTLPPTIEPRATTHIPHMIDMISTLVAKDHAYAAEGHVLFRISSFADYGKLSGRSPDEILAGARVEVAPYKEHPGDFVLWKPSSPELPGWESPWGRGRPGWHIECSAMSHTHLGFPFDIHGGGHDLLFPHHENEVAQGTCATGKTCSSVWMHNGMLTVDGQKMSKSLGNFITMDQILAQYKGGILRYALLSGHYRQNLDWNQDLLHQSTQAMNRFYKIIQQGEALPTGSVDPLDTAVGKALSDDLNTPAALAELHQLATQLNKSFDPNTWSHFWAGGTLLGLFKESAQEWFQTGSTPLSSEDSKDIEALIDQRQMAKAEKNFDLADTIRRQLLDKGIVLEDHKDKRTSWRIETSHG